MVSTRIAVEEEVVAVAPRAGAAERVEVNRGCAGVVGEDRVHDLDVRGALGVGASSRRWARPAVDDRAVGDDRPAPRHASGRVVELEGEAVVHAVGEDVQEQHAALAVQVGPLPAGAAAAGGGDVVEDPVHEGEGPVVPDW